MPTRHRNPEHRRRIRAPRALTTVARWSGKASCEHNREWRRPDGHRIRRLEAIPSALDIGENELMSARSWHLDHRSPVEGIRRIQLGRTRFKNEQAARSQ